MQRLPNITGQIGRITKKWSLKYLSSKTHPLKVGVKKIELQCLTYDRSFNDGLKLWQPWKNWPTTHHQSYECCIIPKVT